MLSLLILFTWGHIGKGEDASKGLLLFNFVDAIICLGVCLTSDQTPPLKRTALLSLMLLLYMLVTFPSYSIHDD